MKALFFDTFPYEEKYLKENSPKEIELSFRKDSLNNSYNGDFSPEIISVFISSNLDNKVLEKFSNLKYVLTRSVGFSHIDLNYCKQRDIKVFNTPHYGDYTVAEFTFGILLNAIRKIAHGIYGIKTNNIKMNQYEGVELFNKTLGVIGAGAIGKRVLDIAKGFGMNAIAYDTIKDDNYTYVELDELFKRSDVISINCCLNEETHHLIRKENIEKMKDGVIIVNVARGEIIDTQALYDALISKKVSYAALDVIECEEMLCSNNTLCEDLGNIKEICLRKFYLNQRLMQLDNVIITPHMAYNTYEATMRILKMTVENLNSCLNFKAGVNNLVLL